MNRKVNEKVTIFIGNIVHCKAFGEVEAFKGNIVVDKGKIVSMGRGINVFEISGSLSLSSYVVCELSPAQLLLPGLVDCHLHAPQFPNLALGLDKPLLQWLDSYTFPLEKQYEDTTFARHVYKKVIKRTLTHGTTTACYFGSLHLESSLILAEEAAARGQRALVGKVSMDLPNSSHYHNSLEQELRDTEDFIIRVNAMENPLVLPVVTPRFALSCCEAGMRALSQLASKHACRIQTHVAENHGELQAVQQMFPDHHNYCHVYDDVGLLTEKTILAHAIHLSLSEMQLLSRKGVSVAHAPASNTRLMSGLCPVRQLINHSIRVGLATDVSGGDSPSIMDAMRRCMDVSSHLALLRQAEGDKEDCQPLSWREAFYLATLGGATALSLDHQIGNFVVGKEFDALLVQLDCHGSCIDSYQLPPGMSSHSPQTEAEVISTSLQKFIYMGDDRNINKVFVSGREINLD